MTRSQLILELHKAGIVRFGTFTLKSGKISPIYIDLRILVSYPRIMKEVARSYVSILKKLKFDRMSAVPYAALPIVASISIQNNKPWIYTRKEIKSYGTKKRIEGEFHKKETAVVVDDLITTGLSKLEVITPLQEEGLIIKDIVVLIDREQGGEEELKNHGYALHRVFTLASILEVLYKARRISKKTHEEVLRYLSNK